MRRFPSLALVFLISCAFVAAPIATPKSPSAPRLVDMQGVEVLTWTVPVSGAVLAGYVPGQKVSTDNGVTFAAIAGLACTGTSSQSCSAPFPASAKGTYQTQIQVCDTQGAKVKCSTGPKAAIDFLPAPAAPSAPACPACNQPQPMTIVLSPVSGTLTQATPLTLTTTGPAASVRLEVLDMADGSAVCECAVTGGPTVWQATLHAESGTAGQYALRPSVTDAGGSTVMGANVIVTVG